jgi:hypothetical protein
MLRNKILQGLGLPRCVAYRPRMNCGLWNQSPFRTDTTIQSTSADFPPLARNLFAGETSDKRTNLKLQILSASVITLFPLPVLAHNVKTSGNVAATFHIEPNHNPKAGEEAQAWFALTKQGGELIPLDRCNCQLKVIASHQTVLQPTLKSISAEQFQGIPGAEIIFPKAGIYKLEISGSSKNEGDFNPFTLSYDVTVQAGQTTGSPSINSAPAQVPTTANHSIGWLLPTIAGVLLLSGIAWFVKRTLKK